ncbi:MAG: Meiotic recombination protein dmc1 [Sclerophora amabilis]|nr:MAG: Meiotic recombination protein dmc1 [Sclerophora amabilis]
MPVSIAGDEFDDDEENYIVDIDTIQAHGIGAADITKLKINGYYTTAVRALGCFSPMELVRVFIGDGGMMGSGDFFIVCTLGYA